MAEEKQEQEIFSETELKKRKQEALNYYKEQTRLLKIRADYEEQLMRISTYQRDTMLAQMDMMRIEYQQKIAEEQSKKEETGESQEKPESEKTNE